MFRKIMVEKVKGSCVEEVCNFKTISPDCKGKNFELGTFYVILAWIIYCQKKDYHFLLLSLMVNEYLRYLCIFRSKSWKTLVSLNSGIK